jgi:hypothetical protein
MHWIDKYIFLSNIFLQSKHLSEACVIRCWYVLNKLTDVGMFFSLLPYLAYMKILTKIILLDNHATTAVSPDQVSPWAAYLFWKLKHDISVKNAYCYNALWLHNCQMSNNALRNSCIIWALMHDNVHCFLIIFENRLHGWWYSRKNSMQLRAGIRSKLEICKLQIWSSFWLITEDIFFCQHTIRICGMVRGSDKQEWYTMDVTFLPFTVMIQVQNELVENFQFRVS